MQTNLTTKRIVIFLAFAFGIAWATALVIYLTGGLVNSPVLMPGFTLAIVLMATFYMWAPALANVATRLITREGWANTWLRPNFKRGWKFYLAAWLLPPLATVVGGVIFYLLFPQNFDPTLGSLQKALAGSPAGARVSPWMVVIINSLVGFFAGITVNGFFAFGEEFGWRAYLLPKMIERFSGAEVTPNPASDLAANTGEVAEGAAASTRKAVLLIGLIWGVWHWPVIFMGYEYGFKYPGAPYVGPILFCVFTTMLSIFLSWVTLRSRSVLPAAIGHGTVNGTAAMTSYFAAGTVNPLLGPAPIGLVGGLGFIALGLVLLFNRKAMEPGK